MATVNSAAEEQKKKNNSNVIDNLATEGYTPLNKTAHNSEATKAAYEEQVNNQKKYVQDNPTASTYLKQEERDPGYTYDASQYEGKIRQEAEGTSGADESLMSDEDYAYLLYLRQGWNENSAKYQQAKAAGNTDEAAQYKAAMEQAHLDAERLRSGYGYYGGTDGSMYIPESLVDPDAGFQGGGYAGSQNAGGAPTLGDLTGKVEDYSSYLEQMYAAKKAAALAEIESAYQQNVAALDRAGEGLEESYQDARNQTAGASELAKRNFAQYAAANGLNSGAGGQAELSRNIALQNNLNSINSQEAQSVADLQLQRANAEVEYNSAIAQAESEGDYELANALYQEKVRVQNALIELEIQQYQLEYQAYRDSVGDSQWQQSFDQSVAQQDWQNRFNQQQFDYGKEQDAIANSQWQQSFDQNVAQQNWQNTFNTQQHQDAQIQQEFENALALQKYQDSQTQNQKETLASYGQAYLQAGIMPSAEMLAAMGITQADAQQYIAAVQSANTGTGTQMNLTTAKQAAENGVFNDQVVAVLKGNGYTDDMLAGIYGYESPETSGLNFARYLYTATKNPDYVYKTLKSSGYSDTEIDGLMAQLGL